MASHLDILQMIEYHQFITRTQLEQRLQLHTRNVQLHLQRLHARGWIHPVTPAHPNADVMWLLTPTGYEYLATHDPTTNTAHSRATNYSLRRLAWLALTHERITIVRNLLFALSRHPHWRLKGMAVQAALTLQQYNLAHHYPDQATLTIPFDGLAILQNLEGYHVALAIEVDTGALPVLAQRSRWAHLCLGQLDPRCCLDDYAFPILVIIAANQTRLDEARRILLPLTRLVGILPYTFLITRTNFAQFLHSPDAPLWETEWGSANVPAVRLSPLTLSIATPTFTEPRTRVPFLHRLQGTPDDLTSRITYQHIPPSTLRQRRCFAIPPLKPDELPRKQIVNLASLALTLSPLDRRLLELIGAHPLLSAHELAFVVAHTPQHVRRRLAHLQRRHLIETHTAPPHAPSVIGEGSDSQRHTAPRRRTRYYLLTERGIWLLAARASFGLDVARFVKYKGWKQGFADLVKHWAHTRLENVVFLQLLAHARQHHHHLEWCSELEARLYLDDPAAHVSTRYGARRYTTPRAERLAEYEWAEAHLEDVQETPTLSTSERARALAARGQRVRSFLPDGRGVYTTATQSYHLFLEVDRTKANTHKLVRKLSYYFTAYYSALSSQLTLPDQESPPPPAWRILVITSGWQRAQHWSDYVFRLSQIVFDDKRRDWARPDFIRALHADGRWELFVHTYLLPVWITTTHALVTEGIAAPIWLDVRRGQNAQQLEGLVK
jgi:predicted ArsR family transcriptional regulator